MSRTTGFFLASTVVLGLVLIATVGINVGLWAENHKLQKMVDQKRDTDYLEKTVLEVSPDGQIWTKACGTNSDVRFYRVRRTY